MFNFFKKRTTEFKTGLNPDPRNAEERMKDFSQEELGLASAVEWKEKSDKTWINKAFSKFFQDSSSSCVSQSMCKAMGIENYREEGRFVDLSRRDFYERRYNKPGEGMNYYDACQIAQQGVTLESLMPSYGQNEAQMNDASDRKPVDKKIGEIFRMKNFIATGFNIDAIASVLQQGKPVPIGVRFNFDEWTREVPIITTNAPKYGHGICALPYSHQIYKGQKAIAIADSTGLDSAIDGQYRILTESFLSRLVSSWYFEDLSNLAVFNGKDETPKYKFTKEMGVGLMNDSEVKKLQEVLSTIQDKDGYLFPLAVYGATGNFLGITRQAVQRFQILKNIQPVTGYVGPLTLAALNSL
jgi:peptidoglycan hydrolase-like protein with peptidoglycan-binding domain